MTLEFGDAGPHEQLPTTVPAGLNWADVRIVGGHGGRSLDPYREVEGGDGAGPSTDPHDLPDQLIGELLLTSLA